MQGLVALRTCLVMLMSAMASFTLSPANADTGGRKSNPSIRGGMALEEAKSPLQTRLSFLRVPYVTNRVIDPEAISRGHARGDNLGFEAVFKKVLGTSPSYGIALVSSPIDRKPGQDSYVGGTRQENPFYNMAFWNYDSYPTHTALKAAYERIYSSSPERKTFLYVHGMDNSFSDAVERLAQLVLDTRGEVVPLAFSWPSDVARTAPDRAMLVPLPANYKLVRATAEQSVPDLVRTFEIAAFLNRDVRLLAHSMGAYVVDQAIAGPLAKGKPKTQLFSAVALAAPDVALDRFLAAGLPSLLRLASRLTVYCSDDYALAASAYLNGNMTRLGQCPRITPALPGARVVQVVGSIADFSRHSYFLNSARVIENLRLQLLSPPTAGNISSGKVDNGTIIDVDK